MNRILQSLFTLILLSVCQPLQVKGQDLIASTEGIASFLLPPGDGDNPKKKKKKKASVVVPGCGEVLNFIKLNTQSNAITVQWNHEGDPSKVKYNLEWTNRVTNVKLNKTIVPTCASCSMSEVLSNLDQNTLYYITINAVCDVSTVGVGSVPQFSTGIKSGLEVVTQSCSPVPYVNVVTNYNSITAIVPNLTASNVDYAFTLRDANGSYVFCLAWYSPLKTAPTALCWCFHHATTRRKELAFF
jgi:hypothetical protein